MQRDEQKRVAIWIRVSTEDQAKGESPEHHEHRARMYAESKGWQVVKVYDLSGVSGKSVKHHPECQAMLDDIAGGRVTGLIFSKLARLARNTKELLDFAEYFQEHDADLVSLQESIDTSTPAGRFFYTMIAALAQWEREEISDRVKASVKVRAKLGKNVGGRASYGYQWQAAAEGQSKVLVLDPKEAPIRGRMFELFLEHRRMKTVARKLNEAGLRSRTGKKFSDNTVKRLLTDPIAKGLRRANYIQNNPERGTGWTFKPESEWIYSKAPAIVSEEVWDQVNAIIKEQEKGRKPYRRVVHLFSGVTFCQCGEKMYKRSGRRKYVCRPCRIRILDDDLEQVFVEQLKSFLLNPEEIARHIEAADEELEGKRALLASLQQERTDVERRMEKTYELYVAGELSTQGFGRRNRPLEERLEQLDAEIPSLMGTIDFLAIQHASTAEIVTDARTLYDSWSDLSFDEKRSVVETVVDKIIIGEETVEIHLAYVPPLPHTPPRSEDPAAPGHQNEPPPSTCSPLNGGKLATVPLRTGNRQASG